MIEHLLGLRLTCRLQQGDNDGPVGGCHLPRARWIGLDELDRRAFGWLPLWALVQRHSVSASATAGPVRAPWCTAAMRFSSGVEGPGGGTNTASR